MQNFGVTNKEHYGMLWYFWSGLLLIARNDVTDNNAFNKAIELH